MFSCVSNLLNHWRFILIVVLSMCTASHGLLREPDQFLHWRMTSSRAAKQLSDPVVYRCGQIGKDLVVNFVNTKYPENDVNGGDCRFRLVISSPDVCQVRVDFVDSDMNSPTRGDCLSQMLEVEGSAWPTGLPPLCGVNVDQHFYLHLEQWTANTSWLDFRVTTVVSGKPFRFGLWLTQIDCTTFNVLRAPEGCTQFYLGGKGVIKSFNFDGLQNLNGQNYRICIKPISGTCGIRYEASSDDFRIRKSVMASRDVHLKSGTGSNICSLDYIMIAGGRESLQTINMRRSRLLFLRRPSRPNVIIVNPPTSTPSPKNASGVLPDPVRRTQNIVELKPQWDRFCGGVLSPQGGETVGKPIFARVRSNLITMDFRTATTQEKRAFKRNFLPNLRTGFKVLYSQLKDCDDNETDLVSPPNIGQLLQNFNANADFVLPLPRDPEESSSAVKKTGQFGSDNRDSPTQSHVLNNSSRIPDDENIWEYLDGHEDDDDEDDENDDDLYDF